MLCSDKKQEEYSDVIVVTTNEAFTQSVNSRNLYSYGAKPDDKMDQEGAINYKVNTASHFGLCLSYVFLKKISQT